MSIEGFWEGFVKFLSSLGKGIIKLLKKMIRVVKNLVSAISKWLVRQISKLSESKRVFLIKLNSHNLKKINASLSTEIERMIREAQNTTSENLPSISLDDLVFSTIYDRDAGLETMEDIGTFDISLVKNNNIDASMMNILNSDGIVEIDRSDIDDLIKVYA